MFPGYTDTMHQANEFMELDDLFRAAIYADAIYRLEVKSCFRFSKTAFNFAFKTQNQNRQFTENFLQINGSHDTINRRKRNE